MKMFKNRKGRKKLDCVQIFSAVMITLFSLLIFIPFWNTVVISFETAQAAAKYPFSWIPMEFTLSNYASLMKKGGQLLKGYKGTLIITIWGTLMGMTISVMAAYGFSRKFPGKKFFFRLMMVTMFFSGGMIPTYLQYKNMGLLNTYAACIFISLFSVHNLIIMKNGFEHVPMDLQEAAMIDGANDMLVFVKIMLPLQKPLLATFSLFSIVGFWNSWYWPMLLLNGNDKKVLQLFLRQIVNTVVNETEGSTASGGATEIVFADGVKMAAVFMVMVPIMVVYPFVQKYFTKGIMVGAVKM